MGQLPKIRVGAVNYLNTVPLVWGVLQGQNSDRVDLSFSAPADCARQIEERQIDVGLVPVAEIARQGLTVVSDVGIACEGAVRSILLFSSVALRKVRRLAADYNSRTSVQLARVILRERYGVDELDILSAAPDRDAMLRNADAALIIGDPALRTDPAGSLDLGLEWLSLTGLPMVFAVWAARPNIDSETAAFCRQLFSASYRSGEANLGEIAVSESAKRGITEDLAHQYLSTHIRYSLGAREKEGLRLFWTMSGQAAPVLAK